MADPLANLQQYTVTPTQADTPGSTEPLSSIDQYISPGPEPTASRGWGASALGVAKDIGSAVVKGGASVLDMLLGPTLQGINSMVPQLGSKPKNLEEAPFSSAANKVLPEKFENPVLGAATEGAVTGGATAGPVGAAVGAIASGGTELLNKYNPEHPIANTLIPMGVGLIAGGASARQATRAAKLASEGLRITDRPELVQAKRDLGINAGTAASTSEDPFWFKMQRGLRERVLTPGASNIEQGIEKEQSQLGSAVEDQANRLFPSQTKQEVGEGVQSAIEDGVDTVKRVFSRQEQALDAAVDPHTTLVDMRPFVGRAINDISSSPGAHIPIGGGRTQQGDKIVSNLMDNIIQYGNSQNGLSVQAIRELKQQVGDQLKESLLNGDANARQLRQMYGVLADAQGAAYAGTPYATQYTALKAAEAEMYKKIEEFAEPLVRKGITPEKMADLATNQMKLGGTKLAELINIMETASPSIKNQLGSSILLNIGKDTQGEFSPQRFFTRWQQIAPEAKQALFGQGPNQDIPKIYDQLALVAQNQARGAKALNTSGTGGVNELWNELKTWGMLLGGGAGIGIGGAELTASKQDQAGNETTRAIRGAEGAGLGAAAAVLGGGMVMGRMLTNPAFLRWIATSTVQNLPMHVKALSAIAAENPNIENDVKSFQEYLNSKHASGGLISYAEGGNVGDDYNTPLSVLDEIQFQAWKQQYAPHDSGADYDLRGAYKAGFTPAENGHWGDEFKKPNHPTFSDQSKYSRENPDLPAGSWMGEQFIPPGEYAEGGIANDNSPFNGNVISFGKQPRGGYAGGTRNPVIPSSVGVNKDKSILDYFLDDVMSKVPPSMGNQISGYTLNPKTQRGAQWDTRSPMNEWSPPIDVNDAANDLKFAEGGKVDRFSQAVQYLTKETGMPEHAAQGAVKYMYKNESKLDPNIVNPTSKALGIGQWLGSRKAALLNTYGPNPTFEQQLEHTKRELTGPEKATLTALMAAKDEKAGYDIWGRMFERPGEAALAKAGVNYSPGAVSVLANNKSSTNSIIDHIAPVMPEDDTSEEDASAQRANELAEEHSQHAASMGADPLVQSVIKTIWSHANV